MHKLLLIEKNSPSYGSWPSLIRKKKISNLSIEEVVDKYQGFEGELIFIISIKINDPNLKEITDQCLETMQLGKCLLLHVVSNSEEVPAFLEKQAIQVGYDVGVCEEEKTIYSSIFHEVLFGNLVELVVYKDLLNENLLFPDRLLAEKYVNLHDELSAQGKDVEDYEKMTIYKIWKRIS